jgi:hypothetical protein
LNGFELDLSSEELDLWRRHNQSMKVLRRHPTSNEDNTDSIWQADRSLPRLPVCRLVGHEAGPIPLVRFTGAFRNESGRHTKSTTTITGVSLMKVLLALGLSCTIQS